MSCPPRWCLLLTLVLAAPSAAQEPEAAPGRGVISGRVRWTGPRFAPREVIWPHGGVERFPELAEHLAGRTVFDRRLELGPEGGIDQAVILLRGVQHRPPELERVAITIRELAARPRVLLVGDRTRLTVANEDPVALHLELRGAGADPLGHVTVEAGAKAEIELPAGERLVLEDARLPFVRAVLHRPGRTPALVTGPDGRFRLGGVPAGNVTLEVWHEELGSVRREVRVRAGETTKVEIGHSELVAPGPPSPWAGGGPVVLRVDGVPVHRGDVARLVDYYRARYRPHLLPGEMLERFAVVRAIVPAAASFARHRGEVVRITGWAAGLRERIAGGASFQAEVAREIQRGDASAGRLRAVTRREIAPGLGIAVFAAAAGEVVGPVFSARGGHLFEITAIEPGEPGESERRTLIHLFKSFRPDLTPALLDERVRQIAERARVAVVDPALRRFVPEGLTR